MVVKAGKVGDIFRHGLMRHICVIYSARLFPPNLILRLLSRYHCKPIIGHTHGIRSNWTLLQSVITLLVEATAIVGEVL